MNGLTRKHAALGGAAALVVGVTLILIPGGSPASRQAPSANAAAAVADGTASAPSTSTGSPSPALVPSVPQATVSPVPLSSGKTAAPPAAPITTLPPPVPASSAAPPQPGTSRPAVPASTPSPKQSAHPPVHTTTPPPVKPPTSAPPAGCASGTGWTGGATLPIPGAEHTSCWAVTTEASTDDPARGGSQDIGHLADGSWAEYPMVDFGTGQSQFLARVASGAVAGISGKVQIHLDSLTNAPVSVFEIANTGGWQTWQTVQMNMNRTTGVHNVYLSFDSGQPQPFVSLHWFSFGN
ncbi:carbohydrate-binding protein [Catenulispora pinisilvae]|uniref:carbohydrate-binding protein n=1 Tax=Catenulispora pinisilvae TaxID=2705253 RepID=UPI001E4CD6BA|nr:carbohydrate-binding protein [Catenulispora pinisilvae]